MVAAVGRISPLASVSATREVLEAHGLSTKKQLGQNFLINDDVLAKIVSLAQLGEDDGVLEVGPGIGTLTIALLKYAGYVVSVERDPDLPAVLAQTCAPWSGTFRLIGKDALDLSTENVVGRIREMGKDSLPAKLVANLPYAVAATIILDYFERFEWIESATVMVQKEVADRIAAKPGTKNYGAYTVKLGMHAAVAGRFSVGPGNFFPPPHVESSVIRLDRRVPEEVERVVKRAFEHSVPFADDEGKAACRLMEATCMMADAAFATRRKTLSNSCKTYFSGRGAEGKDVVAALPCLFESAGIDPKRRGESLSQEEFIALGAAYLSLG